MDRNQFVGTVKTAFELHSLHGDQWLIVKEAPDLRQLEPAAALLVQRQEVDGIRLVRRLDYVDHDFSTTVIMVKRLRAGATETDPLLRANPGRDMSRCDKIEDFYGEVQRQALRSILAKYLDERRLTPIEVLYYETHAKALDQAGTTLQGALQRLASVQVRGTKQTAVTRMKELMALVDEGLQRLIKDGRGNPPLPLAPGRFKAVADQCASQPGDAMARIYRAVAAYLADAKTWVEKLDRLFRLWQPELGVREMRILDSLAAEILGSSSALKELAGQEKTRLELILNAVDLYAGKLSRGNAGHLPEGVIKLSHLLADGILPRTLSELRLGLLRHLHARLPLRTDTGIRDEVRATVEILGHLKVNAPALARDEEVIEALSSRVDRLIQPEAVAELVAQGRSMNSRAELILSLIEQAPGAVAKAKLAPYLRSQIVPDDLIREMGGGSRPEAIKPLAALAHRIAASGIPVGQRQEILEVLDGAMYETIRSDILSNQSIAFADRMVMIIRLCANLPEGRAKQLASDQLSQALRRPEFLINYLDRFHGAQEKRDAFLKLRNAIAESGLVAPSLIPSAA